jgi:ABC-type transporter Mla MlaB component
MHELRLEFQGRLTLANARQTLADQQRMLTLLADRKPAESCKVIADLSGLADVDTSALAVILQLDRDARSKIGQPLCIQGASQDLRSLARLSSLDTVLNWE